MVDIIVNKANSQVIEQDITITANKYGTVTLYGFNATTKERYQNIRPLFLNILSKIAIPDSLSLEQLALLQVLLAETIKPTKPGFNLDEATLAMDYMKQSLYNRLAFSHPHYLDVPKNNPTLLGLIGSGTIEGFKGYPSMTDKVTKHIHEFIKTCNEGANKYFLLNRQLFQNALTIATGQSRIPESNPKLYAWRTKGQGSPGGNFQAVIDLQGQSFYTLTSAFIADPNGNKKGKN